MIRYLVGCLIVIGVSVLLPGLVHASDSELTQEIKLVDCTATRIQNGLTMTTPTECQGAIAPMVNYLETTDTTPTLTGSFDAARAGELEIRILGRVYRLGSSPELVATGNYWTLTLENTLPLTSGTYNVIVEVITRDGLFLRDGAKQDLVILPNHSANSDTLSATGQSIFIIVCTALVLTAGGILITRRYHRPKRKTGKKASLLLQ